MNRLEKLVYCHYNIRLRVRNMQRTNRDSEYFDPIHLHYIFKEDDPLNRWIEEREESALDTEGTAWLDNVKRVAEEQASQQSRRKRRLIHRRMVGSDDEMQPSSDNDDDGGDGGGDETHVGTSGGGDDVDLSYSYGGIAAWDNEPVTMYDTPTFRGGGIEGRGASGSYQTLLPQGPQDDLGYMTSSFGRFNLQNAADSVTSNPYYGPQPTYPEPYDFVSQIFGGPTVTYYTEPCSLLMPQFQGDIYDHGYQYDQHYRENSRTDDDDHEGEELPRNSCGFKGDGRAFWRVVVSEATGCADNDYFEEVYEHFANGDAWNLPCGAYETICSLKDAGVKLAVVSNFDTRLRKLLKDLNVSDLFDAIIISSEVGYEKPAAEIFTSALDQISVEACKAVHVGDDQKADKIGANAVGIDCWLWGSDVKTFLEIHDRILLSNP